MPQSDHYFAERENQESEVERNNLIIIPRPQLSVVIGMSK